MARELFCELLNLIFLSRLRTDSSVSRLELSLVSHTTSGKTGVPGNAETDPPGLVFSPPPGSEAELTFVPAPSQELLFLLQLDLFVVCDIVLSVHESK
jgi:hypothetical protein